jgi:hypothetical protein
MEVEDSFPRRQSASQPKILRPTQPLKTTKLHQQQSQRLCPSRDRAVLISLAKRHTQGQQCRSCQAVLRPGPGRRRPRPRKARARPSRPPQRRRPNRAAASSAGAARSGATSSRRAPTAGGPISPASCPPTTGRPNGLVGWSASPTTPLLLLLLRQMRRRRRPSTCSRTGATRLGLGRSWRG